MAFGVGVALGWGPEFSVVCFGIVVAVIGLACLVWSLAKSPSEERLLFFTILMSIADAFLLLFSFLVMVLAFSAMVEGGAQWGLMVLPLWLTGIGIVLLAALAATIALVLLGRRSLNPVFRKVLVAAICAAIACNLLTWILPLFV